MVAVAQELQLLLPVVENFEEEHPAKLLEPLRVAVSAGVLAHDVLDGFTRFETFGMGGKSERVQLATEKGVQLGDVG